MSAAAAVMVLLAAVAHVGALPEFPAIKASLNTGRQSLLAGGLCDSNVCCEIDTSEDCPLSKMTRGKSYIVYPDRATTQAQCIFGDRYAFQVIPGDADKLMIYFQGGGACWTEATTNVPMCTTDAVPNKGEGVFDPTNVQNPFKDYTIVHALYCSGDVWGGNVTQAYKNHGGEPVVQVGIYNALATIGWTQRQVASGTLAPAGRLSDLVVMGCSAGSLGAQIWGANILRTLPIHDRAAIVPDSYAGVFPPNSIGPLLKSFGMCTETAGLLPPTLLQACEAGQLTVQDMVTASMQSVPGVAVSFIQSKIDVVQQEFYIMVAASVRADPVLITPTTFYNGVNSIFGSYNAQPQFLSFLVDGGQHCFTPINIMYDTTGNGPRTGRDGAMTLSTWLAGFPQASGAAQASVCSGELVGKPSLTHHDVTNNTYCCHTVVPKTYVQV